MLFSFSGPPFYFTLCICAGLGRPMAALWLPDCSGLHGGQVFYFCYLAGKNTSYAVISYACRVMGYMQLVKTFYLYFFQGGELFLKLPIYILIPPFLLCLRCLYFTGWGAGF